MPAPSITPLPDAPSTADSPEVFNQKAFAWVAAIAGFTTEINALVAWLNSSSNISPEVEWIEVNPNGAGSGQLKMLRVKYPNGQGSVIAFGSINVSWTGVDSVFTLPTGWGPSGYDLKWNPIFTTDVGSTAPGGGADYIWMDVTPTAVRVLNASGAGGLHFSTSWPLVYDNPE